jgi:transposase
MLTVDLIRKVRMLLSRGESLRAVSERYNLSRNSVRKIARSNATEFKYPKREKRYPAIGPVMEKLAEQLSADAELPVARRRSGMRLYEELRQAGYEGSYDSVRRYVKQWKEGRHIGTRSAYVPLAFSKGEAFQFDWSEEWVELGGTPQKLQVGQVRLCYSRMRFCIAFTRQELPMLIEAHIRAHDFFGGLCQRGIYDNAKTVVTKIGHGKDRVYNQHFLRLSSHYLFEPEACTPAAGWEKGQIENQVKSNRQSVFVPRLSFADLSELNHHLAEQMIVEARNSRHPEYKDKTVWEVFEEERPHLIKSPVAFDGPVTEARRVNSQCLVNFDRNHYSVPCQYANKQVEVRVYAERLVFAYHGQAIAEHRRCFSKGHHELNPLHYLPLLERKPGALRNGRPFREWDLPRPIEEVWDRIRRFADWDRQMTQILSAIPSYGLEAVSVACETALEAGTVNQSVILNHLSRLTEDAAVEEMRPPERLILRLEPKADCGLYDRLLGGRDVA